MGSRIFTTYIKTKEVDNFPINRIVKELFENQLTPPEKKYPKLTISLFKEGIELVNYYLSNELLCNPNTIWVDKLYNYFEKPHIILAYHRCDSTLASGYNLIKNGIVTRRRYWRPSFKLKDIMESDEMGQPFPEEIEILKNIEDGYYNKHNHMHVYHSEGRSIYFHYVNWDMVDFITTKFIGIDNKDIMPKTIDSKSFDIDNQFIIGEHKSDS